MSRDIRSFFNIDNSKKKKNEADSFAKSTANKRRTIIRSDDEEDTKIKSNDSKKKRRIVDSDDDETETMKKHVTSKKKSTESAKAQNKTVDVKSLFGGTIKRTERPKPEIKASVSPKKSATMPTSTVLLLSDDEDENLLLQLAEKEKEVSDKKDSPGKENKKSNDANDLEIIESNEVKMTEESDKQEVKEKEVREKEMDKKVSPIKENRKSNDDKVEKEKKSKDEKQSTQIIKKTETSIKHHSSQPSQSVNQSHKLKAVTSVPLLNAVPKPTPVDDREYDYSFVDKYKPTSVKQIIGQQGPQSNANKLQNWLLGWHRNHGDPNKKQKPNAYDKTGSSLKAALLSGSPGVGKTTTAHLVCKELLFDVVEFNASDTRSKKLLKDEVAQLLSNKSLKGYVSGTDKVASKRHVLIMDEVDGMAGNEDRGGIAELIALIKDSHIPVICMCNDRSHPKMRSLVNYCFDLRFHKPNINQIRSSMMSICFKEGIKMETGAVDAIISGTGNDVRQTLNHLALYSANKDTKINTDSAKKNAQTSEKDIKIGPWDVIRKVFSAEEHKTMSFNDKNDLFFYDYNIAPLFVQENYLNVKPKCHDSEVLERIAKTADSLSLGDNVDKKIRSSMAWSLLPTQAVFSSVLPGEYMEGSFKTQPSFPSWLGRNSKAQKRKRLAQEIHDHTRIATSGSRMSIRLDYSQFLINGIVKPLKEKGMEGVAEALEIMKEYRLLREDIDSLLELTTWGASKNPWEQIDSKVKAALTRAYNKEVQPYSFSVLAGIKKKKVASDDMEGYDNNEEGEEQSDEEEEDSIEKNSMIKVKKSTAVKESKAETSKASTGAKSAASKSKAKTKK